MASTLRTTTRSLVKNPGFSLVVITLLALGIGAVTTLFSFLNAVLWRSLPFPEANRLVLATTVETDTGATSHVSWPDFQDWRDTTTSLETLAAYTPSTFTLRGEGMAERVPGELVSADYLPLLGATPILGRAFIEGEIRPELILGRQLWQERFGGNPGILGESVRLNGQSFTVVGIAPEGFRGLTGNARAWVPLTAVEQVAPRFAPLDLLHSRNIRWHQVVGRLAPGTPVETAQRDLETVAAGLERTFPSSNERRSARLTPVREALFGELVRRFALVTGAAAFFLLIACINLANLFLTRFHRRSREVAVRLALGARPAQVRRQLLAESLLLGLIGGGAGLVVAAVARRLVLATLPVTLPGFVQVSLDYRVLGFTLLLSLATAVGFGLAPALQATRLHLASTLREAAGAVASGGGRPGRRFRLLHGVVIAEVALLMMLLIASGLLVDGLRRLDRSELGFEPAPLLTLKVELPPDAAAPPGRLLEPLESLPGVASAALSSYVFFADGWINGRIAPPGSPEDEEGIAVYVHRVSPGFLHTVGIPLLRGRDFSELDATDPPPVALVSRSLASKLAPGEGALGLAMEIDVGGEPRVVTLTGIVGDVRHRALASREPDDPDLYLPLAPPWPSSVGVWVQGAPRTTSGDLLPAVRQRLQQEIPGVVIYQEATMAERLARETAAARFTTLLMAGVALLALVLAVTGIYAVLAANVQQRRREMAVRVALGANPRGILRLLVGQGLGLAAIGLAVGLPAAWGIGRLLDRLLLEVGSGRAWIYAATALLLLALAALASYLPARRLLSLDPSKVLRGT